MKLCVLATKVVILVFPAASKTLVAFAATSGVIPVNANSNLGSVRLLARLAADLTVAGPAGTRVMVLRTGDHCVT